MNTENLNNTLSEFMGEPCKVAAKFAASLRKAIEKADDLSESLRSLKSAVVVADTGKIAEILGDLHDGDHLIDDYIAEYLWSSAEFKIEGKDGTYELLETLDSM